MALLSTKLPWELAQTKWASILNPIIAAPVLNGLQIDEIQLIANVPNAINHLLQRMPQGWLLVDKNSNATVWRAAPLNANTITLVSSANTMIDLYVY